MSRPIDLRYLVYNKDKKVLVFVNEEKEDNNTIYLPSNNLFILKEAGALTDKILKGHEDEVTFIRYFRNRQFKFRCINNKLKKYGWMRVQQFYSLLHPFDEDTMDAISEYCNLYNLQPYFLSFEELENLLNSMNTETVVIQNMLEASKILHRKLEYEEY